MEKRLDKYGPLCVYSSMEMRDIKMKSNPKTLYEVPEFSYWMNKKTNTIYHLYVEHKDTYRMNRGRVYISSTNLRWERSYGMTYENLSKNYVFLGNSDDFNNTFATEVLFNSKLKTDLRYGVITKEEFNNNFNTPWEMGTDEEAILEIGK